MIRFTSSLARRFAPAFLLAAAATLTAVGSAQAQLQIPINFASSNGNSSTQTAAYGITPSAGTQQFLLTTINPAASLPGDGSLGTTSANTNVTSLNTYFGLPASTLSGMSVQDGSGYLSQQVLLTAGSVVHFDYVFLTDEDNTLPTTPAPAQFHNDFAFLTVNGVFNGKILSASQLSAAQLNNGSNSLNFDFQSAGTAGNGYTSMTYTVPTTGTYTFGFGVSDVDTNTVYSGLLVDNFYESPIPEPTTWTLLLAGLTVLGLVVRRRAAGIPR